MGFQWSWRELHRIWEWYEADLVGSFVEKVYVPARPDYADGFTKNEWALRFGGRTRGGCLLYRLRPQEIVLDLIDGKGPAAAGPGASRSGFDLYLDKTLPGLKITKLHRLPNERVLGIEFQATPHPLVLYLVLIPAQPEAALVERMPDGSQRVLSRSRTKEDLEDFALPVAAAPQSRAVPYREELFSSRDVYTKFIRTELDRDSVALRLGVLLKEESQILKKLKSQSDLSRTQAMRARAEPDYSLYGDYLKAVVHEFPKTRVWTTPVTVADWETGAPLEIPVDLKLSPVEQVQKFYWLAKRKEKRIEEGDTRAAEFEKKVVVREAQVARLKSLAIENLKPASDRRALRAELEKISAETAGVAGARPKEAQSFIEFAGKHFRSKEGLTILVGRNSKENLELTTRLARGNDMWLHVKGRPGAHTVIILRDRKNASLETLLDAAMLTIFYSGGKEWGKTDVDYTYRKFVKRIKNSTEVTYTQNKTLSVTIDRKRLDELLSQEQ